MTSITGQLEYIASRESDTNTPLILPLVGEFSSGKTTLINALTDSKKLETATKPTTATIYEVHFGADNCHAIVSGANGELTVVNDIADLKNAELADAKVVTVYDTSTRVPESTVLVDTPGLSSPDPRHKQTLLDFLPNADGILLVSDINQQITRTLTEFIDSIKLSRRPVFLVLTKSDSKSAEDIEAAKTYISENCQIPVRQIAVVSAMKGDMTELYALLDNIQKEKYAILATVNEQRLRNICGIMQEEIRTLLKASSSNEDLVNAISDCRAELNSIDRNIDHLMDSLTEDIEQIDREICQKFEDAAAARLNSVIIGKSANLNNDAFNAINSLSTVFVNEYRSRIQELLRNKANALRGSNGEVSLLSLQDIDVSAIQMPQLAFNMDLNAIGHEYDTLLKTGVIALAAAATVGTVAAGAASVSTAGAVAGAASGASTALDVADTVTDVGGIMYTRKAMRKMERAAIIAQAAQSARYALPAAVGATDNAGTIPTGAPGQQMTPEQAKQMFLNEARRKDILGSMVSYVTEKVISKPQRLKAIRSYVLDTLSPEFKEEMNFISQQLITDIRNSLHEEAKETIEGKTNLLDQMRDELQNQREGYKERVNRLQMYLEELTK